MWRPVNIPVKSVTRNVTFYAKFRPLAILAKVLGTFPLENASKSSGWDLKYKLFSLSTLWALAFFSSVIVLLLSQVEILIEFSHQSEPNFWQAVMCYILVVRSILQFVTCQISASCVPKLLQTMEQSKFCRKVRNDNKWRYLPFVVLFVEILGILVIDYLYYQELFKGLTDSVMISTLASTIRIWQLLPAIIFLCLASFLKLAFVSITKEVKKMVRELKQYYTGAVKPRQLDLMVGDLELLRLEHGQLQRAVRSLSKCYGVQFAVDYVSMVLMMVITIYFSVRYKVDSLFLLTTMCNFMTSVTAPLVSHALKEVSDDPLHLISCVPKQHLRKDLRYQLDRFQSQIVFMSVEVSAGGFFEIDKKRVVALVGTVATYLIVLFEYGNMIAEGINGPNDGNDTNISTETTLAVY